MRELAHSGAQLEYLDKAVKGRGSLQRKILGDSKKDKIPYDQVVIGDSLRYTLTIPTEHYASRVEEALQHLERHGFKVADLRNSWGPGAVYQGVNVNLHTPHGVRMELQFHTPESFHVKSKLNGKLYKKWRLESTSAEEQDLLWARMQHNQAHVPSPPGVQGLRRTVKKGYAQILKSNPNHDDQGRFAVDPSGIFDSLEEAGRQHAAYQRRYSDALDALPAGHTIKGWEHTVLEGDHFWTKGKKGLSSRQLLEELGSKALEKHLPEAILKYNPYHDELGRFSDGDSAISHSIGPKFANHVKRMREEYAKALAGQYELDGPGFHDTTPTIGKVLGDSGTAELKVPKGYSTYTLKEMEPGKVESQYLEDPLTKDTISVADAQKLHSSPGTQLEHMYPAPKVEQVHQLESVKPGDTETMKINPKYEGWEFHQVKGASGFEPSDFYLKNPKTGEAVYLSDAQKDHAAQAGWTISPTTGDAVHQVEAPPPKEVPWWKKPAPPKNIEGEPLPPHVHAALPEGFKDFTHWGKEGGELHGGWITNPKTNESVLLADALAPAVKDTGKLNEMYQAVEGAKGKAIYHDPSSGLLKNQLDEHVLDQRMAEASAPNWNSLSVQQKQHLNDYTSDSARLNAFVTKTYNRDDDRTPDWAHRAKVTDEQQDAHWNKRAEKLDEALQYTAIPTNVYSYRTVSKRVIADFFGPGDEYRSGYDKAVMKDGTKGALQSLVGKEFKDIAYGSSSIDYNRAYSFHRKSRVMLRIRNKAGEVGMYFGTDRDRTAFPSEHELLLPRNSRYKIKGVQKLGSTYVLDVWKVGAKKAKKLQPQPLFNTRTT
jgi:hypothetical protein